MDSRGEIAESVFDPAFEDAWIPGLVEFAPEHGFGGLFAGGPFVAPVGGGEGWGEVAGQRDEALDYWVD